jgi:fumarate reductase subunit C
MKDHTPAVAEPYKKKMPILWWTQRTSYLLFIVRELTSVAVALVAVLLLFLVRAISQGEGAYQQFMAALKSPIMLVLSVMTLVGLLFHSITWFNLAPKAMVIKLGKSRLPGVLIALANYIGWVVISVIIVWFFL